MFVQRERLANHQIDPSGFSPTPVIRSPKPVNRITGCVGLSFFTSAPSLVPVHFRHCPVGQDEIELAGAECFQPSRPLRGERNLVGVCVRVNASTSRTSGCLLQRECARAPRGAGGCEAAARLGALSGREMDTTYPARDSLVNIDLAFVAADDAVDVPSPSPCPGRLLSYKTAEASRLHLLRHPVPRVGNVNHEPAPLLLGAQGDDAALGDRVDGIELKLTSASAELVLVAAIVGTARARGESRCSRGGQRLVPRAVA